MRSTTVRPFVRAFVGIDRNRESALDATTLFKFRQSLEAKVVEQNHRAIKRRTRPTLNVKSFCGAGSVLAGAELMHMIRKDQFTIDAPMRCRSLLNLLRWGHRSIPFLQNSFFGSTTRQKRSRHY
jgi:hypothetical protein